MQVDWAGQTAGIVDTDTGELIPSYLFVSVLPYSRYAYVEAFLDEKQEAWITARIHAYQFYGGVTRILTPDNLNTGFIRNTKDETIINKTYQEMAEHYGTAINIEAGSDKQFIIRDLVESYSLSIGQVKGYGVIYAVSALEGIANILVYSITSCCSSI